MKTDLRSIDGMPEVAAQESWAAEDWSSYEGLLSSVESRTRTPSA